MVNLRWNRTYCSRVRAAKWPESLCSRKVVCRAWPGC